MFSRLINLIKVKREQRIKLQILKAICSSNRMSGFYIEELYDYFKNEILGTETSIINKP